ncbi:cytochrome P450 2U1-like [Clavelina lepadiformis]|uniref:cytochrome P450 2U1-like n=1 Tax=Clavelina lepadiformis TaxID=159417 RepID=UPI004041113E
MLDCNHILNVYTLTGVVGLLLLYWFWRPYKFPPGPRGIPFLGILPFLGKYSERKIAKWSKSYGPVISLRFGRKDFVVLNDYESIYEALVKQQSKFSSRPKHTLPIMTDIAKGAGFAVLDYGEFFKSQKRLGLLALRGVGIGKQSIESRVLEETNYLVKAIASTKGDSFYISKVLQKAISNNICSVVFGKRFNYDDKLVEDIIDRLLNGLKDPTTTLASRICTLAPFLKYLPPVSFIISRFKKKLETSLNFIQEKIDTHRATFNVEDLRDFIDAFLSESMKENSYGFTDRQLIFYIRTLLVAGTETAASTLAWALICCLHYPETQNKLREEILNVLGSDGKITMSYKSKMPYTSAFMQELMRFRTLNPISLPHKTNEDSELKGYFIPKDTTVGPNIWAVHNDPDYWDEPEKFKPQRFIDADGEFIKSNHVIPFSLGPRTCLGKQLAQMEIFIYLVSMIQQFEFLPDPNSDKLPEIDDGINGLAFLPYPFCLSAKVI